MTGPARCPASRNGEHVEDVALYGPGFCALCAAAFPAPAVPSGDMAGDVKRPTPMMYCSCGSPWPCPSGCHCPQDEDPAMSLVRRHQPGCLWFDRFMSGDAAGTADTCACGEFDCEACIENREVAGTAAQTGRAGVDLLTYLYRLRDAEAGVVSVQWLIDSIEDGTLALAAAREVLVEDDSAGTAAQTGRAAYSAPSKLALALDLERVLHGLADHLPGEPPAIIAWGPGELAQAVADALVASPGRS